ncbi:MAG: C39 family peptidase [Terriglobales bacterium]
MGAVSEPIPFEKQADPETNRTCGAACLSMVYRSFGKIVPQAEIWEAIAGKNRFGSIASNTFLMARDALNRGFAAVAIQARHPLQVLKLCHEGGIRAILNHRLNHDSGVGHYTVLTGFDDKRVVLHDPFYGPSRPLSYSEMMTLWQPHFQGSEIMGNMLIGISDNSSVWPACEFCHTQIPPAVECPRCKKPVGLKPGMLLGCVTNACIARMWNYVCCPSCDYTWNFSLPSVEAAASAPGVEAAASAKATDAEDDPWNLTLLFGELDKFSTQILAIPAAAAHPDIRNQLSFIGSCKDKLKLAMTEEIFHGQAREEKLAKIAEVVDQKKGAHEKRVEESKVRDLPSPPLDGIALGRALLKNLGFTQ